MRRAAKIALRGLLLVLVLAACVLVMRRVGRTSLFLEAREDVLAVPSKAIKRERGKNIVYVTTNGQPVPREIKIGWRDGAWVEVAAGLKEGEIGDCSIITEFFS
jgi:macrolide-specific efflux system membrane fusion protein